MIHMRNRTDLLDYIEKNCPRQAIVRALQQDGAENLGGFSSVPPANRPGWIVRVRSRFNKAWLVAVIPVKKNYDYEIRVVSEVPWANWVGTWGPYLDVAGTLYHGDKPWVYITLRERAKK